MTSTHRPLTVIDDGGLAALGPLRPAQPARPPDQAALQAARDILLEQLAPTLLDPVAPAAARDPEVLRVLRAEIGAQVELGVGALRSVPTDDGSLLALFQEAIGWGPAQPYLDDERVQEVKIIGDLIMVQEDGADFVLAPERYSDPRQALSRALLLAARLNVPLDRAKPQETLPLAHGTRMHVTIPPCTPEGTGLICIRRGRRDAWALEDIERRGGCDAVVGALLRLLVRAGCSFLIAGETGCGKTALLEAIVNSWPGEPHVVTIEDNTLEINVRHRAWTRELVQSAVERGAFGRAAREVLRQTPSLVAPGETRADEAGAILAVAVSGHAVVTTIHARSAARAVQRFADCAAMPGAYIYEGRRANALEDACDNFQVVIHLEKSSGRRYIDELLLLDGVEEAGGRFRPRTVRLAWAEPAGATGVVWRTAADVVGDDLRWHDGGSTPEGLARRLARLRVGAPARAAMSRAAVDEAIGRAELALGAGDAERALAILRRAWADRPDERLAAAAGRALELDLAVMRAAEEAGRLSAVAVAGALRLRDWPAARRELDIACGDLRRYAAHTPPGGWPSLAAMLEAGEAADRAAHELAGRAREALAHGRARDAVDILAALDPGRSSPAAALPALHVRREALQALCAAGELGPGALAAVDAAIRQAEQARGR